MKNLPRLLTLFLLFALPFVILPFGTSQFEIPKVILAQIAIELLIVCCLLQKKTPNLQKLALVGFLVLFTASLLSMFLFPTPIAFFGNQFRLQGLFLFWHLLLFSLFAKHYLLQKVSPKFLVLFLLVQVGGVFFFGANDAGRAYGFLGEPNALASVAVFALPLLFINRGKRVFISLGVVLAAIILLTSGSRSGVIAAFLEMLFLFLAQKFPKRVVPIFICSALLFAAFLSITFFYSDPHESRVEIWHAALLAFIAHPVIGGGVGNAEVLLHQGSLQFASFLSARYVDSSHNIFLDVLIQLGIIGFLAFLSLLVISFRTFIKSKNIVSTSILIGMIVVLSFNPGSVWELVVLWYLIGSGVTQSTSSEEIV